MNVSRLGSEGIASSLLSLERWTVSLLRQLAHWATGSEQWSSVALFLTTAACILGKKGPMWFILTFFVVRTLRLAIFSVSHSVINTADSDNGNDKDLVSSDSESSSNKNMNDESFGSENSFVIE